MSRPAREVEFFRVWTAEMAYVLGLWWSDGCMRVKTHGAHEIEIVSNDKDHLEAVARVVGENYYMRKVSQTANTYVITFCSKQMSNDLLALGGTPRKSRTIGFPPVPSNLVAHFVRGVIDGDGTIGWNGDRPIVHVYSGSEQFLAMLAQQVEDTAGIPAPSISTNRANWYLKWSTVRAKCLVGWLYFDNPGIALARKIAIAADLLKWEPKRAPNADTITERMRLNFPGYLPA